MSVNGVLMLFCSPHVQEIAIVRGSEGLCTYNVSVVVCRSLGSLCSVHTGPPFFVIKN